MERNFGGGREAKVYMQTLYEMRVKGSDEKCFPRQSPETLHRKETCSWGCLRVSATKDATRQTWDEVRLMIYWRGPSSTFTEAAGWTESDHILSIHPLSWLAFHSSHSVMINLNKVLGVSCEISSNLHLHLGNYSTCRCFPPCWPHLLSATVRA